MVSEFIYAQSVNAPDYMIRGGIKYKLVKDNLGSVLAVVNSANGVVAQQLTYSTYRQVLSDSNPGFQPFGFAGGLYDSDTKLVRFGAREYNGTIGRWMTKDPILFNGGDTNLYGYVMQDPVNYWDRDGLKMSPLEAGSYYFTKFNCLLGDGKACLLAEKFRLENEVQDIFPEQPQQPQQPWTPRPAEDTKKFKNPIYERQNEKTRLC